MLNRLLPSLSATLGPSQAALELRWMNHAVQSRASALSLHQMLLRRINGEPLQYILGTQPFGPLNLLTRPPVLIPRPETEHWVIKLADSVSPSPRAPISLLDLGTGSGCIPLLLCHLWPPGSLIAHGLDISPQALQLANDNASLCGFSSFLQHNVNTFTTSCANILADSFLHTVFHNNASFDIITSNPPYVSWKEYLELPLSVSNFEDPKALFGGPSGLDFYVAIANLISRNNILKPNAIVALEVGHEQAKIVESIIRNTGRFSHIDIWSDPWGQQRTVVGRT